MSGKSVIATKSLERHESAETMTVSEHITTTTSMTSSSSSSSTKVKKSTKKIKKEASITEASSKIIETSSAAGEVTAEMTAVEETTAAAAITENKSSEKALKKKSSDSSGRKKSKKSKKSDAEKENISVKSSFSKFDALQKKNVLHVRSSDAGKAQEKFNGASNVEAGEKLCHSCSKPVFKMEEMKAERNIWHKACFKCSECSKQLNVDTYESHESILYCKPHFRALFTPKAVEDNEPVRPRRPEMIIRENQPMELPPDVVRSSDKTDLGLEELHQLNLKSRYQVFENAGGTQNSAAPPSHENVGVKRSASILSKMARFKSKGMDVGITDESLEGFEDEEEHDSSEDEELLEAERNGEDVDLIRAKRAQRERPLSFANMSEVKSRFEAGAEHSKEERREERKQELQNIRSRLFMGKQAKIKEMYQQAVLDSEQGVRACDKKPDLDMRDKARSIKDRFEKGEVYRNGDDETEEMNGQTHNHKLQEDDSAVFEQGIGKQSRSIFMQMDANAAKSPPIGSSAPATPSPRTPDVRRNVQPIFTTENLVKCDEKTDELIIETADISNKFKFFETYKPQSKEKKQFRITPPRDGVVKLPSPDRTDDIYIDPDVVRSGETVAEDPSVAVNSHTATKVLSMFRQLEETRNETHQGLKPLKRFTPPPDNNRRIRNGNSESDNDYTDSEYDDDDEYDDEDEEEQEEEEVEEIRNGDYVKSSDKNVDEFLLQAQSAARAKQLRAKFERWESKEISREQNNSSVMLYDGEDQSQVETAKEIRAKFECMNNQPKISENREKIKVNRFL